MQNNDGIGLVGLVIIGALIWWGYNTWFKQDTWSLIYINNLGAAVNSGDYSSREECRAGLEAARNNPGVSRPECGSNCKPPEDLNGVYRCDESFEF